VKGEDTSWRHLLESVTHREREQRRTFMLKEILARVKKDFHLEI
jgi:hypothetical protein